MSTPVEMVANVTPAPPPAPVNNRTQGVAREDTGKPADHVPVADAASVRATKVSMAEEDLQTGPQGRTRNSESTLDIMV